MTRDPSLLDRLRAACAHPSSQVACVTLLGLALRLFLVDLRPLWLDEGQTVDFARRGLIQLWATMPDTHPPLYYSLVSIVLGFGSSEFLVRFPSVIFGALAIPALYFLAREIEGHRTGMLAATLLAISPIQIAFSQESRPYTMLGFAVLLSLVSLLRMVRLFEEETRPGLMGLAAGFPGAAALFVAATSFAVYSQVISAVYVLLADVLLLYFWQRKFHLGTPFLKFVIFANCCVFLISLPWLVRVIVLLIHGTPTLDWLEHFTAAAALERTSSVLGQGNLGSATAGTNLVYLGLIVLGIHLLRRHGNHAGALLLILFAFAAPVLIWLVGFIKPVFMLRTVLWVSFAGFIAVALVPTLHLSKQVRIAVLVFLISVNSLGLWNYFTRTQQTNPWLPWEDWPQAAEVLSSQVSPQDSVLLCGRHVWSPLRYYLPSERLGKEFFQLIGTGDLYRSNAEFDYGKAATWEEAITGLETLWIVDFTCDAHVLSDFEQQLQRQGARRSAAWRFPTVLLRRYAFPSELASE